MPSESRAGRLAYRLRNGGYAGAAHHVRPAGDMVPSPYEASDGRLYTFEVRDGLLCCLLYGSVVADEERVRIPDKRKRQRWQPGDDGKPREDRLTVSLQAKTANQVRKRAGRLGVSVSSFVAQLLETAMELNSQREAAEAVEEEA